MAGRTSICIALALALLAVHVSAANETISNLGGTCKYQLRAEVNATHAVVRVNGSTTNTKCPVQAPLFESFWANDTVLSQDLFKSSTPKEALLTVTPGQISSVTTLDGSACLHLPEPEFKNGSVHICQFRYLNSLYHLGLVTTKEDGGEYNTNVTEFLEPGFNGTEAIFTVQQSTSNSSNEITDESATIVLATNASVQAMSNLKLLKAIVKTKYLKNYRVVDFSDANIKPFSNASQPGVYDAGFTFATIVKGTESTCFLAGCDLTLLLGDEATGQLAVVRTEGFHTTEWTMTGLAIGVIIAIVIGVLLLCSCLCGIVYFCRRKTGEHQPLRSQP